MNDLILEVRHLNSFYEEDLTDFSHDDRQQVLRDVSFEIRKGDILGLVGESGSGKTTLAKVILGIVKDYNGEVTGTYGRVDPGRTSECSGEKSRRCSEKRQDSKRGL